MHSFIVLGDAPLQSDGKEYLISVKTVSDLLKVNTPVLVASTAGVSIWFSFFLAMMCSDL